MGKNNSHNWFQDQRVAVFVDVQNMYYSAKFQYQKKLDFNQLLQKIVRGRNLVRATAYIVQAPEVDQTTFLTFLTGMGFEIKSKLLKLRPDGTAKGDWDMGIAIDSIAISLKVDVISLVSGDGDFVDLVNMLKANGIRVEVYSFPASTAEELKSVATEYYPIGEDVLIDDRRSRWD